LDEDNEVGEHVSGLCSRRYHSILAQQTRRDPEYRHSYRKTSIKHRVSNMLDVTATQSCQSTSHTLVVVSNRTPGADTDNS